MADMNEKSPEQMADPFNQAKYEAEAKEIYCIGGERATGIWAVYARGAKHGFKDGYLAGFQKCESTVARPLREKLRIEYDDKCWIQSEVNKRGHIIFNLEADVAALSARVSSLTAALQYLRTELQSKHTYNIQATGLVKKIDEALAEGKADE